MKSSGSVYLLYHFFYPDDVISARLFSDLAEDLTTAGFDVTALPSTRSCHDSQVQLKRHESWAGGNIRRVWRPNWPQQKSWGRFGNALCMLLGWTWLAAVMPRRRNEVMIVGTDPVLAVLIAITWRLLRPKSKIIHWCHDVYPHAAVAEGMVSGDSPLVRLLNFFLGIAYRRCDVIVDLGICMRHLLQHASGDRLEPVHYADHDAGLWEDVATLPERSTPVPSATLSVNEVAADVWQADQASLERCESFASLTPQVKERCVGKWAADEPVVELVAPSGDDAFLADPVSAAEPVTALDSHWRSGRYATLVPWSLVEPARLPESDPTVRGELFGECRLGLLYSGNLGRAHYFSSVLALARQLRGEKIGFCFAGRGPRLESVRSSVTAADKNIRFAGFAAEDQLELRLAAADIHLVTLRASWTGTVVPSKFFGALAAGRPVLFAGSPDSAIARWIEDYGVGWVLNRQTLEEVADDLRLLSAAPEELDQMRQRCFDVYHREFSRRVQTDRWLQLLGSTRRMAEQTRRPRQDEQARIEVDLTETVATP